MAVIVLNDDGIKTIQNGGMVKTFVSGQIIEIICPNYNENKSDNNINKKKRRCK